MPPKIRNSYPAKRKLEIIKYAEDNGNREAARIYNIGESSIRDWRKIKNVLEAMPPSKRARRKRSAFWPQVEDQLKKWVIDERKSKRRVSTVAIRLNAQELAKQMDIEGFKGGVNWCFKFMRRKGLSVREATSVGQPLPADWKEKAAEFRGKFNEFKANVTLNHIGNMDETAMSFDMPYKRTVEVRGAEDVEISTTGAERCNFTVVLCVTADGGKCTPMVIFKRKTIPKGNFPKGIVVMANEKGWVNEDMMKEWIEKIWKRRKEAFFCKKSVLIYDSQRAHITDNIKDEIKKYSQIAVIPGGLTKKLQPLD
jgi:hypothetical protein